MANKHANDDDDDADDDSEGINTGMKFVNAVMVQLSRIFFGLLTGGLKTLSVKN
jgi:hypothetical protein